MKAINEMAKNGVMSIENNQWQAESVA